LRSSETNTQVPTLFRPLENTNNGKAAWNIENTQCQRRRTSRHCHKELPHPNYSNDMLLHFRKRVDHR
jgi:hypothetical protein